MEYKIDYIIARVLSGEASSDDILHLSDWLNKEKQNKEEFRMLKNYWDAEISYTNSLAPEITMQKLRYKIAKLEQKKKISRFLFIFTPLAASVVVLIIMSIFYFTDYKGGTKEYYSYITSNNKSEFTLTDGTHVILNKHSKLTYSNSFGDGSRQVRLEGEGYFEVNKDSTRVFEIKMDQASIKVLGTKFNVKANIDENLIEATLLEGSIRFEGASQKVLLTPDQQLVFNKQTTKIDVSNIQAETIVTWKDEINKYKSRTLKYLTTDLERKYKVKIVILNSNLPNVVVSGSFGSDQTIEEALNVISRSISMKWNKKDTIYYIR